MKAIAIIKYLFFVIGLGMLTAALLLYRETAAFVAESVKTEGIVVGLERSRSSNSTTYRPRVQFTTQERRSIEFESSYSSNPPAYSEGEHVEVLYRRSDPRDARIVGFFSLYGAETIVGSLGSVFFLIGAGIMLAGILQARKDAYLRAHGTPIDTDFQGVEINTSLTVNGRHPFRVLTQWQNPATRELHVFESANLWFDPTRFITAKKIRVFIERDNPRKYLVDLAFLPKLAE